MAIRVDGEQPLELVHAAPALVPIHLDDTATTNYKRVGRDHLAPLGTTVANLDGTHATTFSVSIRVEQVHALACLHESTKLTSTI